jgi:hypothetical protein
MYTVSIKIPAVGVISSLSSDAQVPGENAKDISTQIEIALLHQKVAAQL